MDMSLGTNKKITAIILAAGQGKRMKAEINKQLLMVFDKPIIAYTLDVFMENPLVNDILLVVADDEIDLIRESIINRYFISAEKKITLIVGGKERYNSVYNALKKLEDSTEYVLIHDGARPLLLQESITRLAHELDFSKACILGVKAKDTYKVVDSNYNIISTVNRNELFSIQTPQAFHKSVIVEAYTIGILDAEGITDDSMMIERYTDYSVKLIEGNYSNIKITTQDDLLLMEKIIFERKKTE